MMNTLIPGKGTKMLMLCFALLLVHHPLQAEDICPAASQWRKDGGVMIASGTHHFNNAWYQAPNGNFWLNDENHNTDEPKHTPKEVKADVGIKMGQVTVQGPGLIGRTMRTRGKAAAEILPSGTASTYPFMDLGSQEMYIEHGKWSGRWIPDTPCREWDPAADQKAGKGWIPDGRTITFDVYARSEWDRFGSWGRGYGGGKEVSFEFWFLPGKGGKVISSTFME